MEHIKAVGTLNDTKADLAFVGGKIQTPAHPSGFVQALAVRGGLQAGRARTDEVIGLAAGKGARMRQRLVAISAMAGCAAIFLAACASSSSSSSSVPTSSSSAPATGPTAAPAPPVPAAAGNFDSCSVVTSAEAASALGQAVTQGVLGHATIEGGLACVFYGPSAPTPRDPNVSQADSVRVVVVRGPEALTWYQDYKSKVSAQPESGYGDQAYYDGYASLSILKGDYYLRIAVIPAGAPPSLTAEEQLARAILPKL